MRASGPSTGDQNGHSQPNFAGAPTEPDSLQEDQSLTLPAGVDEGARMIEKAISYHTQFPDPDWHQIAERAADEKDPKKLAYLIKALCDRLEELRQTKFSDMK